MCFLLPLLLLPAAPPTSAPNDDISPEWHSHPSEVGDKCEFHLKQVAMTPEEIIVTGEVYNGCKVALEVDTGMLSRSMLWDLKMFSVSNPFVYYVTTPEGLRISYDDQYRLVDPGETITFTQRRRLRPRRPRPPGQFELVEFLTRAATDIPRAREERVTMLPPGEYGMTAGVTLHYHPDQGKPQAEFVDLAARNMLWVRVTDQGELLPLSGVTSQASEDRGSGSGLRIVARHIPANTGLLAGGSAQNGDRESVRSPATAPAVGGRPGPGCSQITTEWLAPGVVLCRVSQDEFVDRQADRWMPADCVFPLGSSGHPPQVFERMAVQEGDDLLPLNWPSDLRGKVLIRNAEDALAFVRLFSAAESWHCFPEFGYLELTAGTPRPLITGGIDEQAFRSLGLEAPEVVPYKDGFRVRRAVAKVFRFSPVTVSTIDEMVLRDGTYALRVLCSRAIPEGDTRVFVHRPQ